MRVPPLSGSSRLTQRMNWTGQSLSVTSRPTARPSSQCVTRSTTRPLGTSSHERCSDTAALRALDDGAPYARVVALDGFEISQQRPNALGRTRCMDFMTDRGHRYLHK